MAPRSHSDARMGRYTGPRRRVVRRLGTVLHGLTRHTPEDRPYPPGQHGPTLGARMRRRESPYLVRLREKQKVRYYYGLRETQLRRYMKRAASRAGSTADNLLRELELRLDNVVFRLGLAPTIPAARQLVTHGHIAVNGRRVTAPAYRTSVGDVIGVRDRHGREHPAIHQSIQEGPTIAVPAYLDRNEDGRGGRVKADPHREDVPIDLNPSLVIEYYAAR
jgi:small subunit ribosomal protein S4